VNGDSRVNQITAERSQPGKNSVFVSSGKAAETYHIGDQDRG
jgi:hypothetical protein